MIRTLNADWMPPLCELEECAEANEKVIIERAGRKIEACFGDRSVEVDVQTRDAWIVYRFLAERGAISFRVPFGKAFFTEATKETVQ